MNKSKINARTLHRSHNNKHINKEHRLRGKRAYLKRFAYSPQKEAQKRQQQEEEARRTKAKMEEFGERARAVCTKEEIRALCREVWALRHANSAYLGHVERILKARRTNGELPLH